MEVFGGSGETDKIIADKVKSFEIWEINDDFLDTLTRNFPNSKIHICNSIEKLQTNTFEQKFDLILIDNPMSVFGDKNNLVYFGVILVILSIILYFFNISSK